ncbi:MAG: class I SAM-dependent methyltransferase [Bacteroidota bacterium]
MSPEELYTILHYHRQMSGKQPSHRSLGWVSESSQQKRFQLLCQLGDMNGCEIMDLGCGYGDFRAYLHQEYADTIYYGIDCMPSFLEIATRKYGELPNTYFYQGDFSSMPLAEVDYMICCGSFNYRRSEEDAYLPVISKMFRAARKGVGFNMLDASVFQQQGALQGHEVDRVMAHCHSLTSEVKLIQGYSKHDFTIFLYPSTNK